jgi:hypothetical protein
MITVLVVITTLAFATAIYFGWKYRVTAARFAPVLSLEEEANRIRRETEKQRAKALEQIATSNSESAAAIAKARANAASLSSDYIKAKEVYDRLRHEVSLLEAVSEDISFGLYKPQYSFETSEAYKAELDKVYERKKDCIRNDRAATYPLGWTVNNNAAEGKRMIKKQVKIMLRAFNGECDAAA